MENHKLIEANWGGRPSFYANPGQFKRAAISNCFVWKWEGCDYTVSPVNSYCRPILEVSDQGWPGGLRWLHDEDADGR